MKPSAASFGESPPELRSLAAAKAKAAEVRRELERINDQLSDVAQLANRCARLGDKAFGAWKVRTKSAAGHMRERLAYLDAWITERELLEKALEFFRRFGEEIDLDADEVAFANALREHLK